MIFNTKDGLYACGKNIFISFGLTEVVTFFKKVPFDHEMLSMHENQQLVINTNDGLYGLGYNKEYQLGLGHNNKVDGIVKIPFEHEITTGCTRFKKTKSARMI